MVFFSCCYSAQSKPPLNKSAVIEFNKLLHSLPTKEKLIFSDNSKQGAKVDGSIIHLHFFKNNKLQAYTFGRGFSVYHGSYTLLDGNKVKVNFENQIWPELILSKEGRDFVLERSDGLKSLTGHIIFTDDDGQKSMVNDLDIYPEAESKIFPLKMSRMRSYLRTKKGRKK